MDWFAGTFELFRYAFIQRALIAGCFIALSCSVLGIFLILRRLSLLGDGLAHVSFATIALGLLLRAQPLLISIPLVALSSLWILQLSEKAGIYADAAIGLVASFSIALGVLLASLAGGFNVDLFSYLFGNILSISGREVVLSAILSLCVVSALSFFYNDLFLITFDEEYAKVCGIKTRMLNKLLIVLASLTVVLGIKVVGTMLVSSLIILPAASALQLVSRFKPAIILSVCLGVSSVILGIFISFFLNLPSGATIVQVNFFCFVIAFFCRKIKG